MTIRQFPRVLTALLAVVVLSSCRGVVDVPPLHTAQAASSTPKVSMVVPQTNGVGTNRKIGVVFDSPMDPASINASTFVVAGASGSVTYDSANQIAAFQPSPDFAVDTTYNASITTGARDIKGAALAAPFNFSFTTRATTDTSPPEITAVNVAAGATCVPLDQKIRVTFSEQMDSLSINANTVFIDGVAGSVTFDVASQTATLTPSAPLAANKTFTLNVTTGVKDLGEVALAAPFQQTFSTGPCTAGGISTVPLCPFIGNFSVLAGSTVTNTGSSVISGDVGVSPGSAVTGFPPGLVNGTIHIADGAASRAQDALTAGFIDAAGRSGASSIDADLVGKTFTAGIFKAASALGLSGDVTLDAQGNSAAIFIFQIPSTLITSSGSQVILANGASACNVFWQVGSSATLGTNSVFKGNILALTSITVTTGVHLDGRALARNGAVTLDSDVISGCSCP